MARNSKNATEKMVGGKYYAIIQKNSIEKKCREKHMTEKIGEPKN